MTKQITKARNFTFIIYPESIPEDWVSRLERIDVPIAISPLHDKDETERKYEELTEDEQKVIDNGGEIYKKAHYHVLYIAKNPVTSESVRKKIKRALGNKSLSHIEIVDGIESVYKYLTHESKDAIKKNKHKYDSQDIIHLNDFDIERYIFLDESQKRSLKNDLLSIVKNEHIVNVIDLVSFLDIYGEEYGIDNMNYVQDVITSNASAFRLWFEGNYQCGYRARYSRIIDSETGEIK
ncbi:replication protein [Staphylococcus sp. GDY8P57P]|uniref:replication protein n=1 Tax=Staphylococcus sp. GDY8P57P TaxID=2804128 RepID=UPI001AEC1FA8|nr:replication protein [Staphylococcus sp. GDY8P57P]